MRHLWPILRHIRADQRQALMRGAALSAVVLAMGAALLGLSGWFITAAAAAGLAGAAVLALALAVLWALAGPGLALWIVGGHALGALVVARMAAGRMLPLSRRAERAAQAFRTRLIDLIRARADLAVQGRLVAQAQAVAAAEARRLALRDALNRAERRAALALALGVTLVAAGALALALAAAQAGTLAPALGAMAFFAALALAEGLAPLRRALSDFGRMADAARRVGRDLAPPPPVPLAGNPVPGELAVRDLTLARPGGGVLLTGLSLVLKPGQTLALTGASGSGKSTLLLALAGLHPPLSGQILLGDTQIADWPEPALRRALALLPQRGALMAGTMAEALRLSGPADDPALWAALRAVRLDGVIAARGGLAARLGPRGAGLSGGEGRRLALARALLRRPGVLLLDEPIEGLMAFFLEATFVGLFFFGWDKLSKVAHLTVAWLVAIGSNLSALWILIAKGWMQNPVGAEFNPHTMRMEMTDFFAVLFNEVAQAKFVHTVSAGYVTAAVFVIGVSAW